MPPPARVDFADPRGQLLESRDELTTAFEQVLGSGRYILGEQVAGFEREWATACGAAHVVGVSSGTDALALALRGAGIVPGDEVLVPAMTAIATWMAVAQIGARPVGVDIERGGSGVDPSQVLRAIGPRTRALVAVHLFGEPAEAEALASIADEHGLALIEDCAQAHGGRLNGLPLGSFGRAAAYSFYPTKNLGAIGDAGAVTSDDEAVARRVAVLREYGCHERWDAAECGINARLDELQAAFLRVGLRRLGPALERRRLIAARYLEDLAGVAELELPRPRPGSDPAWHLFVVRHPRRDALAHALAERGIGTLVHYTPAPALAEVFRDERHRPGMFPHAERHAACALSLPLHPGLDDEALAHVIATVRRVASSI
jgi:dTDP-3-amino-3,4,6-trideoxy-alpha-D-glucose transaminase